MSVHVLNAELIGEKQHRKQGLRWSCSLRRKLIVGGVTLAIVAGLAIGLGVGLTVGKKSSNDGTSSAATASPTSAVDAASVPDTIWKPKNGSTWDLILEFAFNHTVPNIGVWDIDLYANDADTIQSLQSNGSKVICYFSAGSYENWRPDKDNFTTSDLGSPLDGWPGEYWLNVSSSNVRTIMLSRLDLAVVKGCNGVDPDNVDGYDNDNGLDLTEDDAIQYMEFLADAAHSRNLSIGLKNAGAIVPYIIDIMEWSVQEQCVKYDECDLYMPFIEQGKPVFHVEYPKGDDTNNNDDVSASTKELLCADSQAQGFSTILKNMLLDNWIETC
ncbi:hypothetical protein UCRPC4_g03458 [Phaeomoniella chlamydospora]|uniref:alpha-galactosidase n=1 Tax=Phaeomoniella chlamydospora TaxID=158046 RepID=A0A0G2EHI8_PHACM|nr:hypothetical protein UCRPC4_g03458 [Phaeomoniella chlamydospora]